MAWERHGECNHCGHCCHFRFGKIEAFLAQPDEKQAELMRMLGFRDAEREGKKGLLRMTSLSAECPNHQQDRCAIYEHRPAICREWPTSPEQVRGTPCSYWFEDMEGKEKPVGGEGSPYGSQVLAAKVLKELEYRLKL